MEVVKIALSGKLGSGKTTVANELCAKAQSEGRKVFRHGFGNVIRVLCRKAFGYEDRRILQAMGGGFLDVLEKSIGEKGKYFWMNLLLNDLDNCKANFIVVDSVRYPHEVVSLKEAGFKVYRLKTSHEFQKERREEECKDISVLRHDTEVALDNYEGGADFFTLEFEADLTIDQIVENIAFDLGG
jgi:hypothetical protein